MHSAPMSCDTRLFVLKYYVMIRMLIQIGVTEDPRKITTLVFEGWT